MEIKKIKQIQFTLSDKDVDSFKSIIEKIDNESKNVGFNKLQLVEDEQKLIKDLKDNL